MCGIAGYVGERSAVDVAVNNLKRLEYRGYDSSGVAFPNCTGMHIVRAAGKIANLETAMLAEALPQAHAAIAHTRWATHGAPCERNAHPHRDCTGAIAVVHNGIIENFEELRRELKAAGHEFTSDTDTEVIAHLVEDESREPDLGASVRRAVKRLRGAYAIAVLSTADPDTVYVARKDSPLVIGLGEGENFIASDIPAVMKHTRRVILLQDGDVAAVSRHAVSVTDVDGNPLERLPVEITWDDAAAEKGGYDHFMLKEIHEAPRTVRDTLRGRLGDGNKVDLPGVDIAPSDWQRFRRISIVGCGTAYHAGVVGKRLFEQMLRRPVDVSVASEFRYGDPLVDAETLVILISQSGETADTLAAMREARARGARTLAVVNVVGSTLAREADAVLLTQAGPEIGVASTKAYLAQLVALALLGQYLRNLDGAAMAPGGDSLTDALRNLPAQLEQCLKMEDEVRALAVQLAGHSSFFYLGRGYDYAAAMEAALKLKEISYIHAEAFAAGEMKHGPLALVEPGVAIVGFCTQPSTHDKMLSNLEEVKARLGTIIAVVREGDATPHTADYVLSVPATVPELMPVVAMVPMQMLAYYVALARGCEIDQPRNLAKSVTVE